MAGKTTTTSLDFAFKKLMGKANTSNLKSDAQETIGSNIQVGATTVFGVSLPSSPAQTIYTVQNECVEYVAFDISPISGTTYDADDPGGGGDENTEPGAHGYALALTASYQSVTDNTKAGTFPFTNSQVLSGSAGALQVIPEFFSSDSPNPYTITLYESASGGGIGDQIPLLDEVDWMLDTFNGVLFIQDYSSGKVPAYAKGFIYTGDMMSSLTASSGAGSGTPFPSNVGITGSLEVLTGISGSLTHLSDGTSYLLAGNNIQIVTGSSGAITITGTSTGDITSVVAGTGLSGGGASGDVTLAINDSVTATLTGSQFSGNVGITGSLGVTSVVTSLGISGSLTHLSDGTSYLVAGNNIQISTGSSGAVTITGTSTGDITSVVAGTGLTGGGASGDVTLNINNAVVATLSGSQFSGNIGVTGSIEATSFFSGSMFKAPVLSGSLTKLHDGSSYLVAGSGITIASASNGSVTITNDGTVGDITGVTAGTGLTGGGTSGTVTLDIDNSVVATLSGSQFTGNVSITGSLQVISGITGSITRLSNGASYLSAGSNVTITSASNGQIVIAASTSGGTFTRDKQSYDINATVTANTNYTLSNTSFSSGSYNPKYIDVYVNGMLLHSGTTAQVLASTQDYAVTGNKTVKFAFDLVADDSLDAVVTNSESSVPAGNDAQYVTWESTPSLTDSKILTGSGISVVANNGSLVLNSDPYRVYYDITGSHLESSPLTIPGARFTSNSYNFNKTEVFLNGVLMTSGSSRDYTLAGTSNQVIFNFSLESNDTIVVKQI